MPGTHIALLRGINVGTAKRVAMADLSRMVEALGYTEVRTLLNSGNVVFSAPRTSADKIGGRIEAALDNELGVRARVLVLTANELATIVAKNPLLKIAEDHSRLFVAVMASGAARARVVPLSRRQWPGEALALGAQVAYMWCPGGALKSPLALTAHKILKDEVTTRNWATILKLQALVDQ